MRRCRAAAGGWLINACLVAAAAFAEPGDHPQPFHELDQNRDGVLSPHECAPSSELCAHWASTDRNGDGVLDPSEFEDARDPVPPALDTMPSLADPERVHTKAI